MCVHARASAEADVQRCKRSAMRSPTNSMEGTYVHTWDSRYLFLQLQICVLIIRAAQPVRSTW